MNLDTGAFVFKVLVAIVLIAGILKVLLKPVIERRRRKRFDKKVVEFYKSGENWK